MTSETESTGSLCALPLKATPTAVREGRELVRELLESNALGELADDAMLVVTELIGNAIRFGDKIVLFVHLEAGDGVVVRVWDPSPAEPTLGDPCMFAESGRGLLIVESLSDEWGWTPDALGGKTVWARLSASACRAA